MDEPLQKIIHFPMRICAWLKNPSYKFGNSLNKFQTLRLFKRSRVEIFSLRLPACLPVKMANVAHKNAEHVKSLCIHMHYSSNLHALQVCCCLGITNEKKWSNPSYFFFTDPSHLQSNNSLCTLFSWWKTTRQRAAQSKH